MVPSFLTQIKETVQKHHYQISNFNDESPEFVIIREGYHLYHSLQQPNLADFFESFYTALNSLYGEADILLMEAVEIGKVTIPLFSNPFVVDGFLKNRECNVFGIETRNIIETLRNRPIINQNLEFNKKRDEGMAQACIEYSKQFPEVRKWAIVGNIHDITTYLEDKTYIELIPTDEFLARYQSQRRNFGAQSLALSMVNWEFKQNFNKTRVAYKGTIPESELENLLNIVESKSVPQFINQLLDYFIKELVSMGNIEKAKQIAERFKRKRIYKNIL